MLRYVICSFLLFFPLAADRTVVDLLQSERSVYSQMGEDGVIEAIFRLIGTDSKYYVEFGAWDGKFLSNTKLLRVRHKWKGLLLDSDHQNPSINLHKAFITAENINDLFKKHRVPKNLDLLSIDIDFNDFYIWKALDNSYRPRVIVIEYNSAHLPHEDKVVLYDPHYTWDRTDYFGASILAYANLGKSKGYTLVYAEQKGVNLFFVRTDLLENRPWVFKDAANVSKLYRPPSYGIYATGKDGRHAVDPLKRPYISSVELLGEQP